MLYKTQWAGLSELSWEREIDLHLSRSHILRYWVSRTQLAKTSFDEIFDLTAGVYFYFHDIIVIITVFLVES